MNISILALGSRGDVLPYIALGERLQDTGHRVCLATFQNFQGVVAAHGLDYHPIQGDVRDILASPGGGAIGQAGRNTLRLAVAVMRSFGSLAEGYARNLTGLAAWKPDLIVNQLPGGLYGMDLAEKLGVPMILASVIPLTPTATRPMLAFPPLWSSIPGYNLATHWLAYQIVWQGFRGTINRWRRNTLGLEKAPLTGYFGATWREIPVLNGFSAHVVPRAPDWGDHVHITGYWFPQADDWTAPQDLRRFLDAGSPPVFIGFGSMPIDNPREVTGLVLEALRQSGQRGVLQAGWGGIGGPGLPANVYPLDYVPYGWLFPRMAAVVHHGGSGTTAFGLRSGAPGVIIPFAFDQFYWGARLHSLGVGPRPIPYRKLSARRLAQAISEAISNPEIRSGAQQLAVKIRAEDGLRRAVTILEGVQAD